MSASGSLPASSSNNRYSTWFTVFVLVYRLGLRQIDGQTEFKECGGAWVWEGV
jgi:hypothetical protein